MPGPKPKDPDQRARRNKASTAADLSPADERVKAPHLTKEVLGFKMALRPQVQRWWREAWHSPMAGRWIGTDVEVLYVCAQIRQQIALYIVEGKSISTLAAELRQQEARVGLDVMARRRLDWRIEGPRREAPVTEISAPQPEPEPAIDPRRVLRAVQ